MTGKNEAFQREMLAGEIADLTFRQSLIITCDEVFAVEFPDQLGEKFSELLNKDRKDLALMRTVQSNFGVRMEPKDSARHLGELLTAMARDDSLSPVERVGVYALLRQNQMMSGHLVHKATQHADLDVLEALGHFLPVQTNLAKRNAEVAGIFEEIGVFMITGEEAERGMIGRLRDIGATLMGAVATRVAKPAEEMSVLNVLRMDHMKAKTLFKEIESEKSPDKIWTLYRQLYIDLVSHSKAEEQTVYQRFMDVADMSDLVTESREEHEELRRLLDDLNAINPGEPLFDEKMDDLKNLVTSHVDKEEDELFKIIRSKCDKSQLIELSSEFAMAKAAIQATLPSLTETQDGGREFKSA